MIVDTATKLKDLLKFLKKVKATHVLLDSETSGLDPYGLRDTNPKLDYYPTVPARACGWAIGVPVPTVVQRFYVPIRHELSRQESDDDARWKERRKHKNLPVEVMGEIVRVVEDRGFTITNHHLKFDLHMLAVDGFLPDEKKVKLEDTMLLAHILNETLDSYKHQYSLQYLANRYAGAKMALKDWVKDEHRKRKYVGGYQQFTIAELGTYAEDDVATTWKLRQSLYPRLTDPAAPWYGDEKQLEVYEVEMQFMWVIRQMEENAMKIDRPYCLKSSTEIGVETTELLDVLQEMIGNPHFNPASHPQMLKLWGENGWPVKRDELTDSISFGDMLLYKMLPRETLPNGEPGKALPNPDYPGLFEFIRTLSRWRSLNKAKNTYFDNYLEMADQNDLVHAQFHQNGTATGRLSSSKPNMENIPKVFSSNRTVIQKGVDDLTASKVRAAFIPRSPDHRLVGFDFAQQEIRLLLHYVDEPTMQKVLIEGGDIHELSASAIFGGMPDKKKPDGTDNVEWSRRRHMGKFINFGIIYGLGSRKLAAFFEIAYEQAQQYIKNYLLAYPKIKEFVETVRQIADERGYVKNFFGRRRRCRPLTEKEKREGKVYNGRSYTQSVRPTDKHADAHKMLNSIIQGGAADLTRRSMIRQHEILKGTRSLMVNQIHDEVVFELHVDEMEELMPKLMRAMTDWPQFRVPFTTEPKIAEWDWSTSKASIV